MMKTSNILIKIRIMNKVSIVNKPEKISQEKSYLCEKKWLITLLKWIGYFPIITNAGLTKFQTRLISWSFILHVLRASVILFFHCVFLVQNIHPNTWKIIPIQNELNRTENIQKNNSFEVSYKFDFRTIVDYAHFCRLLSYILILSIVCDPFSERITALCKAFRELDTEMIGNQDRKTGGFGKIYSS